MSHKVDRHDAEYAFERLKRATGQDLTLERDGNTYRATAPGIGAIVWAYGANLFVEAVRTYLRGYEKGKSAALEK